MKINENDIREDEIRIIGGKTPEKKWKVLIAGFIAVIMMK